ncbi:MAG TPA: MATE family efflux transporter [Bryobacteraceae bacterium]|jgi:MATE family multidrug resistance protein|nr:MATE family efflux transporter [Bryobacteraceae bacterium]
MIRLAGPLVLAELGWMAMGVVDTMFVGRVGAEAIGAVGLGTMVFYGVSISAAGLLLGLDTLVARAYGAGDRDDCRRSLASGLWLAGLMIPFVMGAVWALEAILPAFGVDQAVLRDTGPYLHALIWSAPPLLIYFALRRYLQALHIARPVMITLLTANLVNLAGNWILVLGHLGAPRLGAEGAGWATCFSRVYMAGALAYVLWKRDPQVLHISWRPHAERMWALLKLGAPAAGQMAVEIGVFATVTVLVSKLNATALAGHQIALTTVSTTFMMPLGVSSAAAVRVGFALGKGNRPAAARAGWMALGLGAAVMSAAAIVLLTVPEWIARLFSPEVAVIAAAATILRVAAFFQLFDGLQIVVTGSLRGAGDTRTPMLCHLIGYWVIGLPLGAALCFGRGMGAPGLWIGLSAGLIAIGVVLTAFWWRKARQWRLKTAA